MDAEPHGRDLLAGGGGPTPWAWDEGARNRKHHQHLHDVRFGCAHPATLRGNRLSESSRLLGREGWSDGVYAIRRIVLGPIRNSMQRDIARTIFQHRRAWLKFR